MADERIDVEVTDKVSPNVEKKLRAIATNANQGATAVQRLKSELASISDTPTARLKAATDGIANSLNRELDAQKGVKAATAQTTAAIDKETAAQDRLSKMIDRSIAKYDAQRKAAQAAYEASVRRSAGLGAAGAAQGAGAAIGAAEGLGGGGAAAEAAAIGAGVASAAKKTETAVAELETVAVPRLARFKMAALGAFDAVRDGITRNGTRFRGFIGGAEGVALAEKEASAIGKVGHAAVANSTAIREMFVLAREGARGDFTRMAGSVSILAQSLGLLHTVLIPLVLILGTVAAGMKLFQMSIRSDADPILRQYANSLGLTSKEMRKLHNETIDAHHKLKEFDATALTMGDTFHGFVQTAKEGLAGLGNNASTAFNSMGINWGKLWDGAKGVLYMAVIGFYGLVKGFIAWAIGTFENVIKILANIGVSIASVAAQALVGIVNAGISALNYLADKSNSWFGTTFGQMEKWHAEAPKLFSLSHVNIGQVVGDGVREADATLQGFSKRWKKNAIEAGKERIKGLADAIIANRNPHHKRTANPKTQDDFITDENKKLDDQIRRMSMLKDARETQQQMDEIEEAFIKRRMPLDAAQLAGFRKKVEAIQAYKYVQAELDRMYEEAISPQRSYNATIAAADDLMKRGTISAARYALEIGEAGRKLAETKDLIGANTSLREYEAKLDKIKYSLAEGGITQAQANEQTILAKRAYEEATNPLFAMQEAMEGNVRISKAYGVEVERSNYLESIRQAYAQKGKSIIDASTGALNAEVAALVKKNNALLNQQYIQNTVGAIVNPMLDQDRMVSMKAQMYAEIDRLRQADVLKEGQASRARLALDEKFNEIRLAGAQQFFGELAGLSSSSNKKLAAIGKAAAVAQATIDGYLAVQKALSSLPPPWSFLAASAVAVKTGANVAAILSTNVGNFKDGGDFIVQGRSGVDQNNISMNVSRGERIKIETPAQQRANDRGGHGNVTVPVKVVNIHDPSEIPSAMDSEEGEKVIMNILRRNPRALAKLVQAGN